MLEIQKKPKRAQQVRRFRLGGFANNITKFLNKWQMVFFLLRKNAIFFTRVLL